MIKRMAGILVLPLLVGILGCAQPQNTPPESAAPPVSSGSAQASSDAAQPVSSEAPQSSVPQASSEPPEQSVQTEKGFDFASKTVLLNDGNIMPILGLGTWQLTGEVCENAVYAALKSGYRLIDTARYYGNEEQVGNGVRKAITEGIVTREEVFITTKLLPTAGGDYAALIDQSNQRLGLDYIDLMLIHQQGAGEVALYQAMEQAVERGVLRSLGISNYYTPEAFEKIAGIAKIMPAVVQNENHIFHQSTDFQAYLEQYGTVLESYYPFGGRGHTKDSFENETIVSIGDSHGVSAAQVLVRWHLQAGFIAIPGSSNPDHIAENFDVFGFSLTDAEMQSIAALNANRRYEVW